MMNQRDLTPINWTDEEIDELATFTPADAVIALAHVRRYGSPLLVALLTAESSAEDQEEASGDGS